MPTPLDSVSKLVGRVSRTGDNFYVSRGGVDYRVDAETIVRSSVPSASELSTGTNFTQYIEDEIASVNRAGPILLPDDDIFYSNTLTLNYKTGVTIQGVGQPYAQYGVATNWNLPERKRNTRLIYTGSTANPAILFNGVNMGCLRDLGIQHQAGGTCLHYNSVLGAPSNYGVFDRVTFWGDVGVDCAADGYNFNSADISFRSCQFQCTDIGVRTRTGQSVCFTFSDLCYWLSCNVAIHCIAGGNVFVFGCATNSLKDCFLRIGPKTAPANAGGGSNVMPCVIYGLAMDRSSPGSERVRILDATYSQGGVMLEARGIKITRKDTDRQDLSDMDYVADFVNFPLFAASNPALTTTTVNQSSIIHPNGALLEPTYIL